MAVSSFALLALVALLGNVQCQFPGRERDQTAAECLNKVMDIFFILDSSTSIYVNDYRRQHQFVRDVVTRFDISERNTRVGVLTFSDELTRPVLGLNRFQAKADVLASITEQNLPYRTGVTNTDLAIRFVRENPEFRQDITKVIVVVTDGGSRSPGSTAREAQLAREEGFYLFVVGVGQYLEEREWRAIASDPDESFIYNITNFRFLDTIKYSLPSRACPLPPIIIGGFCNVVEPAHLMFVAGPVGTRSAVQVIDNFVERSADENDQLRLSYLMGICSNAEDVRLGDISNYCNRFSNVGEASTDTYRELLVRARDLARRQRQERPEARQVAVLFVDAESARLDRFSLRGEIRNLDQNGVDVIVVDLGGSGLSNFIQQIAPSRDNYIQFQEGNVASQRNVQRLLLERTCRAVNYRDQGLGPFNPV